MTGVDIGVGLAAIGAIAAAVSARAAARGVALDHRPYVYGEPQSASREPDEPRSAPRRIAVRLHNDGPGTAVEVRWRIVAAGCEPTEWTTPIRAMQPGETHPPDENSEPPSMQLPERAVDWYVESEYGDIRGARWRLRNDRVNLSKPATSKRVWWPR
jgi:hypothetical protein